MMQARSGMRIFMVGALLALATPLPGLAQTQQQPPRAGAPQLPPLAAEATIEATKLLRQVKSSSLEPYWRAAALARAARAFARTGDQDTTRTMARDAALALREKAKTPAPPALSDGPINTLIATALLDIDDKPTALAQAREAQTQLAAIADPATRAAVMPYLAATLIDLGERDAGAGLLLEGLRAAAGLKPGRDQSTALLLVIQGQSRLGDKAAAQSTLAAFRSAVAEIAEPMERAFGLAMLGRAEAVAGNGPAGRTRAREAATAYDRAAGDPHMAVLQRVSTLSAIILAQAESGDRTTAQSTAKVLQATIGQISQPFERCQALVVLADTVLQIER